MKSMTPTWFGALLMASAGLVYCGGSDSPLTTPSGSGGATSGGSGGRTTVSGVTGTGTTTSGTTGVGGGTGVTTGTTTAATTTTGGTGGAATGGAGGNGTAGNPTGGTGGAVVDAGLCPAMQPMFGTACTNSGEVCNYPGAACTCTAGIGRDGGPRLVWNCAGGGFDGGFCPQAPPNTGMFCMGVGNVCVYPMETCTCQAGGMMMGNRWNCL
jgi:hypothetical protein